MDDKKRKEAAASLLKDMEATSARMRELIVAMPPHDLLGYIYAQRVMKAIADQSAAEEQCQTDASDALTFKGRFSAMNLKSGPSDSTQSRHSTTGLLAKERTLTAYLAAISQVSHTWQGSAMNFREAFAAQGEKL
jgi:hypothetical protein